ncbi:MAG: hypothetical protein HXX20_25100 [Chloroflexi bacterium]|nr:hypothetical protein [Chloroflexota bacterium]
MQYAPTELRLLQIRDLTRPEVGQDQLTATSWRSVLQDFGLTTRMWLWKTICKLV